MRYLDRGHPVEELGKQWQNCESISRSAESPVSSAKPRPKLSYSSGFPASLRATNRAEREPEGEFTFFNHAPRGRRANHQP